MTDKISIRIGPVTLRCAFSIASNLRPDINLLSTNCQFFEQEFSDLHEAVNFLQTAFTPNTTKV